MAADWLCAAVSWQDCFTVEGEDLKHDFERLQLAMEMVGFLPATRKQWVEKDDERDDGERWRSEEVPEWSCVISAAWRLGSSACYRPSFTWATSATRGRPTGTTPSTSATLRCCRWSRSCWRYGHTRHKGGPAAVNSFSGLIVTDFYFRSLNTLTRSKRRCCLKHWPHGRRWRSARSSSFRTNSPR